MTEQPTGPPPCTCLYGPIQRQKVDPNCVYHGRNWRIVEVSRADLSDRIAEVLREHLSLDDFAGDQLYEGTIDPNELAEAVTETVLTEVASWDFLMALLNRHYPEDIFLTMEDRPDRDPGPRIVSLIRHLDKHRAFIRTLVEKSDRGVCPVCSYLWSECACGVGVLGEEQQ